MIVKQQCSDFVMTRDIQCREIVEDVQRQMSGLSFQDGKNNAGCTYSTIGQPHQTQRPNPRQLLNTNVPNSTPTYQIPQQQTMPTYAQTPPYGTSQQPPPQYHGAVSNPSYPPSQHQQPAPNREYGQPEYPGWHGQYQNTPPQQTGAMPRPPYTVSSQYPPPQNHSGYYRQ